jgi:hypothetical protein
MRCRPLARTTIFVAVLLGRSLATLPSTAQSGPGEVTIDGGEAHVTFPPAAPGAPPSTGSAPLDFVLLRDGTAFRGVIVELVPDDHLTIRLPSGEMRVIPMNQVLSTVHGPSAAREAAGARESAALPAPEVSVHFDSNQPGTKLFVQAPARPATIAMWNEGPAPYRYEELVQRYRSVCAAPCDATLPLGAQRLLLAPAGGGPVLPGSAASILGPVTIRGTYEDRRALRIAGWVLFGASIAAGAAMIFAAVEHKADSCTGELVTTESANEVCVEGTSPNNGLLAGGYVVLGVGAIAGVILGLQHDRTTIEVTPMPQPLTPTAMRREGGVAAMSSPEGAGLRIRF